MEKDKTPGLTGVDASQRGKGDDRINGATEFSNQRASSQDNNPSAKTIFCTGGGGFLASTLIPMLLDEGHRVIAFDVFPHGDDLLRSIAPSSALTIVHGDIRALDASLLTDVDVVVHLAGLSNDASCEFDDEWARGINLDATVDLGRACKSAGVSHMVFASSCSVYGAGLKGLLDEDAPIAPLSLYAQMKYDAEIELRELIDDNFGVLSFRMGTLFGASPQMRFDLVANMMTLCGFRDGRVCVGGGGKQWRPMLHVHDAARVFSAGIHRPDLAHDGRVFNVVGANCTIGELGELVGSQLNAKVDVLDQVADPRSYRVLGDAIVRDMNISPIISMDDGVRELHLQLMDGTFADPSLERYYPTQIAHRIHEQLMSTGA